MSKAATENKTTNLAFKQINKWNINASSHLSVVECFKSFTEDTVELQDIPIYQQIKSL